MKDNVIFQKCLALPTWISPLWGLLSFGSLQASKWNRYHWWPAKFLQVESHDQFWIFRQPSGSVCFMPLDLPSPRSRTTPHACLLKATWTVLEMLKVTELKLYLWNLAAERNPSTFYKFYSVPVMSLFMLLWSVYVEYSRKWREMVGEGCCQCYPRAGIGGIYSLTEWSLMMLLLRRLEVLLDRSWEKESITWTGLTWWDPLPCGQDFVVQVHLIWTTRFH